MTATETAGSAVQPELPPKRRRPRRVVPSTEAAPNPDAPSRPARISSASASSQLSFAARLHRRHLNAAVKKLERRNGVLAVAPPDTVDRDDEGTPETEDAEEETGAALGTDELDEALDPIAKPSKEADFTSDAFFASLARHSRLRPDLIALDLDTDEYTVRAHLASYATAAPAMKSKSRRLLQLEYHEAAREVSSDWMKREDAWAEELLREDKQYLKSGTSRRMGLVKLVQKYVSEDNISPAVPVVRLQRDTRDSTIGNDSVISDADAFDLAQRRHVQHGTPSREIGSSITSEAEASRRLPTKYASPTKVAFKHREEEEEATFAELSAIPVHSRTGEEQALVTLLRTRLRSRKRKREKLEKKRSRQASRDPSQAVPGPFVTINGDSVNTANGETPGGAIAIPAEADASSLEPSDSLLGVEGRSRKKVKPNSERFEAEAKRMEELTQIGRSNLSPSEVKEWERFLKRREGRERMRRKKAAREAEEAKQSGASHSTDSQGNWTAGDAVWAGEDSVDALAGAAEKTKHGIAVADLPEKEEDLFNVEYFKGTTQSSQAIQALHAHLRTFLRPLIHRSITYAEILAPALLAAQKARAKQREYYASQKSSAGDKSRAKKRRRRDDSDDEAIRTDFFAGRDAEGETSLRGEEGAAIGVGLRSVSMALEPLGRVNMEEMAIEDGLNGPTVDPEMAYSRAYELLELDNSDSDDSDSEDGDTDDDDSDVEGQPEQQGETPAGNENVLNDQSDTTNTTTPVTTVTNETRHATDTEASLGKTHEDDVASMSNTRYARLIDDEEAEMDEQLDLLDTALDKLAERDLELGLAVFIARKAGHTDGEDGKSSTSKPREWGVMMGALKPSSTDDEEVDNMLQKYYETRRALSAEQEKRARLRSRHLKRERKKGKKGYQKKKGSASQPETAVSEDDSEENDTAALGDAEQGALVMGEEGGADVDAVDTSDGDGARIQRNGKKVVDQEQEDPETARARIRKLVEFGEDVSSASEDDEGP